MKHSIKLELIPEDKYSDYRYNVIFKACKWDPQFEDNNTISKHVVILDPKTVEQLKTWVEQLSIETMHMEEELLKNLFLTKNLGLPGKIRKTLNRASNYARNKNVRLMRFDFHPTKTGWAISEVNSDVPGGFAEASILPEIANTYFTKYAPAENFSNVIIEAFKSKTKTTANIAFVHATSYSDDRQVMQFLSDRFTEHGMNTVFAAPDHIRWVDKKAFSILEGNECEIDGIIRFFPLEWLVSLPRTSKWQGYYDCETVSCNHPVAILTQSKRLPLIWDKLNVKIPMWKKLLPETKAPKTVNSQDVDWIYKPALGRVGEGISIKEAVSQKELLKIEKEARRDSKNWVSQKMFESAPIKSTNGEDYHLCLGVFTVDGKFAGFYGRISLYPRIDSKAEDIPVLVSKESIQ
ncbi:MAG: glutathionylspermidine synthase family protein [Fibromonadaceae bacterium]|jgi:glutathionylspermidine synthase|nr:glutathionylspermidine synthase family protein [Fibromonadaceae bacterium]